MARKNETELALERRRRYLCSGVGRYTTDNKNLKGEDTRYTESSLVANLMDSSSNQFTPECEVEEAVIRRSRKRSRPQPQPQVSRKRKFMPRSDPSGAESDRELVQQNGETSESEFDETNQSPADHSDHNLSQESLGYRSAILTEDQWNSDRGFLQHQILLLKSPFEIEEGSTLLSRQDQKQSRSRRQMEGCIPSQILQNTLRKLNHRVEDGLQRHLTRQAQRNILNQLQGLKKGKSPESIPKQVRPQSLQKVALLREAVHNAQESLLESKKILSFARDICKEAQIFDMESFSDDVKRANQLVSQILNRLESSRKDAISNKLSRMEPSKHDQQGHVNPRGYLYHQAVVEKLFSSSNL